jgi:NodT family efflux transporter outer membrane factor (OMF) lipoprotein
MHKQQTILHRFLAGAAALVLAGCAVGPDYQRPASELPERFSGVEAEGYAGAPAAAESSNNEEARFWRSFGDPLLATLVEAALLGNQDVRTALARYEQARALLRQSRFDYLPTVTASGTAADSRASAGQLPGVPRAQRDGETYEAGIEAAWELDFFGRVRRGVESRRALAGAGGADLAAAQVMVAGELVRSYFELRGLQAQLRVAGDNATNQRRSLELVQARLDAGSGTEFDVARARAQLEGTLSRLPSLEAQIAVTMNRICVLTGRPPGALHARLASTASPLTAFALPARVPVGTPAGLLRRRPDITAAERRLAAATARIGVATADLFPRLMLGGLIGSQSLSTGGLFERDSETHLLALGVDWSFLDIGRVRARIAAADADAEAHLAQYQQTVLLALEETENAMARYARVQQEREHLERAAAAGAEAARLARLQFDGGAADFLQVLDTERTLLDAEDRLAQGRTRAAVELVALYRALAGGWTL